MKMAERCRWLDGLVRKLADRRGYARGRRPRSSYRRLCLERLEDRLAPATIINIVNVSFGGGSLDNTLIKNKGIISILDGANGGTQVESLSTGALSFASNQNDLSITARTSIFFNSLGGGGMGGSLALGNNVSSSVFFNAAAGDIAFADTADALVLMTNGVLALHAGGNMKLAQLFTNGGAVDLAAGGGTLGVQLIQTASDVGDGDISLRADSLSLNGPLNAGKAAVTLTPNDPTRAINLGTNDPNQFSLTQADLNLVTAGVLRIGAANATGGIAVAAPIHAPGSWTQLSLTTAGSITEPNGSLLVPNLAAQGAAGVALLNANAISVLTGGSSGGSFDFVEGAATSLNIGAADGVAGVFAAGSVALTASGANTILTNNTAIAGADVVLTADQMILASGTVNAGAGLVTLRPFTATTNIDLGGILNSGDLSLSQTDLNTITAGVLIIGAPNDKGNLTVAGPLSDAAAGWKNLTLIGDQITFAAGVTVGGTLNAVTTEADSNLNPFEEDIAVLPGVAVESIGGDVIFQSGDSVVAAPGSLVKADAGAVDVAAAVQDSDADGVLSLQGSLVAAKGVHVSPALGNLALTLSGLASPGALPIALNGSFSDPATGQAHTVTINWGDESAPTLLVLPPGVASFSSSHVFAVQGNFQATVTVANSSGQTDSGGIVVPVLPAQFSSIVAVNGQPGQTVSSTVVDPLTGAITSLTLVLSPTDATGGELLAAKFIDAGLPAAPGAFELLAAYDIRQFHLTTADQGIVTFTLPVALPPGAVLIIQYLDPATGTLQTFIPSTAPNSLALLVGPNFNVVSILFDDASTTKLTALTGTEFTISAALPAVTAAVNVSHPLAVVDSGAAAAAGLQSASFQSTSQLTLGLAASENSVASAGLLSLNASSSGGDAGPPPADAGAALAQDAWARFVAEQFSDDPTAVWDYGGEAALRLWLQHYHGPLAPAPPNATAPANAPKENTPPRHDQSRRQAVEFLFLETLEMGKISGASKPPIAPQPGAIPAAVAKPIGEVPMGRGSAVPTPTPARAYLWAALGGIFLGNSDRKRRKKEAGRTPAPC